MPDDFVHFIDARVHQFPFRGRSFPKSAEKSDPSVKELLTRNSALTRQNNTLTQALARLTPDAVFVKSCLTPRQHQIMALVLAGQRSKTIAAELNISQRTVENHRAAIMRRTGATSLPALARMAVGLAGGGDLAVVP